MSYKIEINADSLSELGGKLLALASQFYATAASAQIIDPVMPEVREAEDKPKRARKAKAEEPQEDVGNAATAAAETASSPSDTVTAQPETSAQSETSKPIDSSAESSASDEPAALDFENDVAPVVIDAVGKIGKEAVSEVLSQFGATRASEVDPAQWGELVDALKAKL